MDTNPETTHTPVMLSWYNWHCIRVLVDIVETCIVACSIYTSRWWSHLSFIPQVESPSYLEKLTALQRSHTQSRGAPAPELEAGAAELPPTAPSAFCVYSRVSRCPSNSSECLKQKQSVVRVLFKQTKVVVLALVQEA